MTKPLLRLVSLLLALGLVAAACGGDDEADSQPEQQPAQAEPEPADEPEVTPDEPEVMPDEPEPADEPKVMPDEPEVMPDEPEAMPDEPLRVAFFGFAAANGFAQATWAGVQEGAAAIGAEVEFFDPVFDANTQISQIQDAITAGDWDAFVIQANDGNAVVPVIEEALAAGIPVVGEFTPIGPDYSTIEPQVDGLIFVGAAPVDNGVILAEMAIEACEGIDPCNVAFLEGFRALPLDVARTAAFHSTIAAADGVELITSIEGGYLPDTGLSGRPGRVRRPRRCACDGRLVPGDPRRRAGRERRGREREADRQRRGAPGRGRGARGPLAWGLPGRRARRRPHCIRTGRAGCDRRQPAPILRRHYSRSQREGDRRRDR